MRNLVMLSALASASAIGIAATPAELQRGRLMRAPDHDAFPTWAYGPGGKSAIFDSAEEIPAGWVDHPSKVDGHAVGGGVQTATAPANASTTPARAAKSTIAKSDTIVDPTIAATSGVGGLGTTPATGDTASQTTSTETNVAGLDANGHAYDPALHAGTGSKTRDGLWRMKVGVKRPDPAPGYPLDL